MKVYFNFPERVVLVSTEPDSAIFVLLGKLIISIDSWFPETCTVELFEQEVDGKK